MRLLLATTVTLSLSLGAAHAACTYPAAPESIPDGSTATMEDMLAAQKQVKQFDADITAYQNCLTLEQQATLAEKGEELTPEQKQELENMLIKKQNAAVDDAQAVAARFNEQVRVFKEHSKK
ncbi:MAG: hypothetical protein R3E77_04760 [Steroidobacteraceae bacterium]